MVKKVYRVENLDCANCASKVEAALNALPEVQEAVLTYATMQLRITAEDPDALLPKLQEAAQKVEPEVEFYPRDGAHTHHSHTGEHEHHHEHDENCTCGCHDHDHHHHHHADEIFTSWGFETPATYTTEEVEGFLKELDNEEKYGIVLRAKGMIPAADGTWIYFDYVPEESNVRAGKPDVTGKICVIGSKLKEAELENLFRK